MIFVSYYTKKTPYETVLKTHLLPSLQHFGLEYDIEAIDNKGSWAKNTAYKPQLILNMLKKHKQDVCFLDADARIVKYPRLLFEISDDYDLACHFLNWYGHWRKQWNKDKFELLSGTMIFKYKPKVLELVEEYKNAVNNDVQKWEQKVLQGIVENRKDLKIYKLPASYCCVVMQDYSIPEYISDPIIVHTQASRIYKRFE